MSQSYSRHLALLRHEIQVEGARAIHIDRILALLLSENNEEMPRDVLLLLSDKASADEGMFSLIHAAESVDDRTYVSILLSIFPRFMSAAPRWTSIVLMRVLNNRSSQQELIRQLRGSPGPIKDAVRAMCDSVNAVSPEFLDRTKSVIVAAT